MSLIVCGKCKAQISEGALYCPHCGAPRGYVAPPVVRAALVVVDRAPARGVAAPVVNGSVVVGGNLGQGIVTIGCGIALGVVLLVVGLFMTCSVLAGGARQGERIASRRAAESRSRPSSRPTPSPTAEVTGNGVALQGETVVVETPAPTGQMPAAVEDAIKAKAAVDWSEDYSMQGYVVKQEMQSWRVVQTLSDPSVPMTVMAQMKAKAEREWMGQYVMQEYVLKQEVESYRSLHVVK